MGKRVFLGAILCLAPSVAHGGVGDCAHYLSTAGYYVQEASPEVLRSAIDAPESGVAPKVYADTIDQDFTPNERQQAEALAIRLALEIQDEGGPRNPFGTDVDYPAEQFHRLRRHPRGPELIELWERAGWRSRERRGRPAQEFLVQNGLPRTLYYRDSVVSLAERIPSARRFVRLNPSPDEREALLQRSQTLLSLAARGHPGAISRLMGFGASMLPYWFFHEFRPGEKGSPVVLRPHPDYLRELERVVLEPQMDQLKTILRVMRGDRPVLEDFLGWGSLIRQAAVYRRTDSERRPSPGYLPSFFRLVVVPRFESYLEGLSSNGERRRRLEQIFEDLAGRDCARPLREAIADAATHPLLREFVTGRDERE